MAEEPLTYAQAKNAADRLILAEIHQRLDWIDTGSSACISQVMDMENKGLIEQYRFSNLEIKVNGTWYKRP